MPPPSAGTQPVGFDPAAAVAHLVAVDPVLAGLVDRVGPPELARDPARPAPGDHYGALLRAIVGQQLSVLAARAIYRRLLEFFGGHTPSPQEVLDADPEAMRAAAGLSRAKLTFLRSLAGHVLSGELELDRMDELPDEEVMAELCAVKGLGEWTVHMFLMFQLERTDVMAPGDQGLRRAVQQAYGLEALPTPAELLALAEPWRPYRSVACRLLWRSLDNAPA